MLLVLLLTAIVMAAGWAVAYALTPAVSRPLLAWYAGAVGVLVCVAAAILTFGITTADQLRERIAEQNAAANRLADETMPALVRQLREGSSLDTALADLPGVTDDRQRIVLRTLAEELGRVERGKAATLAACANAAGRVQALTTSMMAELREMEDRADDEALGDLLLLDHSTAQAGRLADSIAVLTGARSGRRWTKPIVMESVLRGAVGRINAYQRVRLHSAVGVAVVGYAAEGVIHVLAELIDNATRFSPPSEQVHVYVEEGHAGVVVTIEDSGLGMRDRALARAEQTLAAGASDLSALSGSRLGLAVVGRLAEKYDLRVSFRPSSRGGTGVVVMIPRTLVTEAREENLTVPVRAGELVSAAAPTGRRVNRSTVDEPPAEPSEPEHLPLRRRGETLAAAMAAAPGQQPDATPPKPRVDPGASFGAFRSAIRGDLRQDNSPTLELDTNSANNNAANGGVNGDHPADPDTAPDTD